MGCIANFIISDDIASSEGKLIALELDVESGFEPDIESKGKSKNTQYLFNSSILGIFSQNFLGFSFVFNILSHQDLTHEVLTSPPDNC